jgi:ABC-type multidrug transport system fused ATPase/permease subunit
VSDTLLSPGNVFLIYLYSVDGIDICSIGLEDLRSRVTLVSQDVALFTGSVRSNLDPWGEHSDQEVWDVLER